MFIIRNSETGVVEIIVTDHRDAAAHRVRDYSVQCVTVELNDFNDLAVDVDSGADSNSSVQ